MRSLLSLFAFKTFAADKRGTVTILAAAIMVGVVGMAALAGEFGLALEKQTEDQRIADAAAFAAASYYSQHGNSTSGALTAAQNVASLNGVVSSCAGSSTTPPCVTATVTTSPANATVNALKVSVYTSKPLYLAEAVSSSDKALTIYSAAYAQLPGGVSDCITALNTSTGVTLSGGTGINAPNCGVSSAASITVPCGTTLSAKSIKYEGSTPSQPCSGITTTSGMTKVSTVPDPLNSTAYTAPFLTVSGGSSPVSTDITRTQGVTSPSAPTITAPTAPSAPTNNGTISPSFNLSSYPTTTQTNNGCTASYASNTWSISCPAGHNYNFANVSVASYLGLTLSFTGNGSTTVNFPGAITVSSTWNLGAATYNFLGGLSTSSGNLTFGTGNVSVVGNLSLSSGSFSMAGGNLYVSGAFSDSSATASFASGGTYTYYIGGATNFSNATVSFNSPGTYEFMGGLTTTSGGTFVFNNSGGFYSGGAVSLSGPTATFSGSGAYNINGGLSILSNGTVSFSNSATFNVKNGLYYNGSASVQFPAGGTFNFGANTTQCSNSYYSICDSSSTSSTFGPSSNFALSSGVYVGGGSTLTLGTGTSNSFHIGKTSDTYAYSTYIGGGSQIKFGDTTASSTSNPFQMSGNYYADAGGGSCSTFSAATDHDINGYVVTAGGMTLGSGTYTINGYIAFGDNGGGSVSCNGTTVGMTGTGVTFIVTGATTPGSGTCTNMVLCFGAGFNYVTLIAPTSGNFANALFIGPLTGSGISAGALFSGGAGASMSGALYIPSGVLTMSGGAYINTNSAQTTVNGQTVNGCLQIVAQSVSMSGGTTAASTCLGTGSGSSKVSLVQ